ncbi:hypothetical protein ACLOJK_018497 [Asimina triloba]
MLPRVFMHLHLELDKSIIYGRTCIKQRAPADYKVEHIPCSTISNEQAGSHGAAAVRQRARLSSPSCPSSPPNEALVIATTLPPSVKLVAADERRTANGAHEEGEPAAVRTHHYWAVVTPIQVIHHDGNNEHIPNSSRPQPDVDHSGHTRQIFLARHQQMHLHPAPINGSSQQWHQTFSSRAQLTIHFSSNASIFVSVTKEPSICRSRPFIMWTPLSQWLATHRPTLPPPRLLVHASVHSLDDAFAHSHRTCVRLPITASTRCDASTTPPPRSPVANYSPFRTSAMSAWACRAHSDPRRWPTFLHSRCRRSYSAHTATVLDQNRL